MGLIKYIKNTYKQKRADAIASLYAPLVYWIISFLIYKGFTTDKEWNDFVDMRKKTIEDEAWLLRQLNDIDKKKP